MFGAVSTPGELTLPLLLKTAGFFLKMFFKSNSTLGRTRGLSGLGLGNPAKNRLYCSTTRSESSALSISMSLLGAKTLSETQVIKMYIFWPFSHDLIIKRSCIVWIGVAGFSFRGRIKSRGETGLYLKIKKFSNL